MRLDRSVTLLAHKALPSPVVARMTPRLPVLMYHSVSATAETGVAYYQTATDPAIFASQMQALARDGYTGVTLTEGLAEVEMPADERRVQRPVVLTFDDGYRDFLLDAVPILQRHGFRATMYLPTGFIGDNPRKFNDRDCLTWSEVAELHRAGFEFGSHTVTHPRLVELPFERVAAEVNASKATIEQRLGVDVASFAYPYAFPQDNATFVRQLRQLLERAEYRSAVTTVIGRVGIADDRLCLRRLPVNSCDDTALLRAKLQGCYDWVAVPQAAAKRLKRLIPH